MTSTTSPCLSSSKYCATCPDGLKNLNLNLTDVFLLNCLGVIILEVFVIGFKPDVFVWSVISYEPLVSGYLVITSYSSLEADCSLYANSTDSILPPSVSKSVRDTFIKLLLNILSAVSNSILSEMFKFVCIFIGFFNTRSEILG